MHKNRWQKTAHKHKKSWSIQFSTEFTLKILHFLEKNLTRHVYSGTLESRLAKQYDTRTQPQSGVERHWVEFVRGTAQLFLDLGGWSKFKIKMHSCVDRLTSHGPDVFYAIIVHNINLNTHFNVYKHTCQDVPPVYVHPEQTRQFYLRILVA